MGRPIRAALAVTLFALCFAHGARAQDFDGFRIPDSRTLHWTGSLAGWASRQRGSFLNISEHSSSFNGTLSSRIRATRDSDPVRTSWNASGWVDGRSGTSREDMTYPPIYTPWGFRRSDARNVVGIVDAGFLDRRYPWRTRIGFELATTAVFRFGHQWSSSHRDLSQDFGGSVRRTRGVDADEASSETRSVAGTLTLGFGRVRDATPVAEAWILERRLERAGTLRQALSRSARERLSSLFAERRAHGEVFERPARTMWKAIAEILADDGALSESGWEAFTVPYAGETVFPDGPTAPDLLPSSPIVRERGWFVGPAIAVRHTSDWSRRHYSTSWVTTQDTLVSEWHGTYGYHDRRSLDEVRALARGEYHQPIGERWQLDGETVWTIPAKEEQKGLVADSFAMLSWILHDKWLATGRMIHRRDFRKPIAAWSFHVDASLRYFIEDRLSVGLSALDSQERFRHFDHFDSFRDSGLTLTLDYTFVGRLLAPERVSALDIPADHRPR